MRLQGGSSPYQILNNEGGVTYYLNVLEGRGGGAGKKFDLSNISFLQDHLERLNLGPYQL